MSTPETKLNLDEENAKLELSKAIQVEQWTQLTNLLYAYVGIPSIEESDIDLALYECGDVKHSCTTPYFTYRFELAKAGTSYGDMHVYIHLGNNDSNGIRLSDLTLEYSKGQRSGVDRTAITQLLKEIANTLDNYLDLYERTEPWLHLRRLHDHRMRMSNKQQRG